MMNRRDQCPYYHQLTWQPVDGGIAYVTHDCAARKTMLMVQELFTYFIRAQQASEQERNASHRVIEVLTGIIKMVQENPNAQVSVSLTPQIEDKDG